MIRETPLKVLITGGTGSLGTAILRRAKQENWPARFSILARNETKMAQTLAQFPSVSGIIGDVRDRSWLATVFPGHDLVIHAAAVKIVPVAEANPREAIQTNVMGSLNVAQAAVEAKVGMVVGISSDKACGPTYYGLTKRLMEGVFRQANAWGETKFVLCRYGNVLKSANSIVPLFERQIKEDVPFTITDLRMTRFWLSMKDAIDLILRTINTASPGTILVPKAPAMSVVDLAKALDPDRKIVEIGIRPGERLHETLIVREESLHTLGTQDMFYIYPPDMKVVPDEKFHRLVSQYEYTSDKPCHWLSREELFEKLAVS